MLEKAPEAEYGGNARYSGTGFRFVHAGADEIRQFLPDIDDALDEQDAKRAFWSAFRVLGEWYAELPPY